MDPWTHEFAGRLDQHVVSSQALKDNPLGDPSERPLYVITLAVIAAPNWP